MSTGQAVLFVIVFIVVYVITYVLWTLLFHWIDCLTPSGTIAIVIELLISALAIFGLIRLLMKIVDG